MIKERLDYIRFGVFVLAILVVLVGTAAVAASPSSQGDRPVPVSIERDEVQVGDVIATGVRRADGKCEYRDVDALAPPGTKTSEQHVFSYGYGGQGDKLTHKYGGITFHWDPYNNAFLDDRWGSCDAATWTSGLGREEVAPSALVWYRFFHVLTRTTKEM